MIKLYLKRGKEKSVERFHPWVFSGAIAEADAQPEDGDGVAVCDFDGKFLAEGHFNSGSIAVRLISFRERGLERELFREKIEAAAGLRRKLGLLNGDAGDACRIVHGEGDGLPGLIIDYYNGTAVIQAHSYGMYKLRTMLGELLSEIFGRELKAVYCKSKTTLPKIYADKIEDELLSGEGGAVEITENGCRYTVDIESGQKTGFFLDQRDNRSLLGSLAKGKKVLNMFCYTGGFTVAAIKGGAVETDSVDSSKKAAELTKGNIGLNFGEASGHGVHAADAYDYLRDMDMEYDIIVLDPPAYAKHLKDKAHALKGYRKINGKAMEKIKDGGLLFTFSCSQAISRDDFRTAVFSSAASAGKEAKVLYQLSQPPDHPVSIFHPEGEYLKGLVVEISARK